MKTLLYFQSGGPTPVINNTLVGVCDAAAKSFGKILGAKHALEGLINEELYDLSSYVWRKRELLRCTPSAALGTSRKELHGQPAEIIDRIFNVLEAHKITDIITNGGGDTSETALTLQNEALKRSYRLRVVHAPKTIDNDLPMTDHSPGFGTAATYVANTVVGNILDSRASNHVKIDIVMGRVAGWLTAAALLAEDAGIQGPDLIFVREQNANLVDVLRGIDFTLKCHNNVYMVISEGYGEKLINIDKTQLSSGSEFESFLARKVKETFGRTARIDKLGYAQRSTPMAYSKCDSDEAYRVGKAAVKFLNLHRPVMVSIKRESSRPYKSSMKPVDLALVATPGVKREAMMPREYTYEPGIVRIEYLDYLRPLAGKINRVCEFSADLVEKKTPPYKQ